MVSKEILKVVSFNVNGLNNRKKMRAIESWIKTENPAVILLQETHIPAVKLLDFSMFKSWAAYRGFSSASASLRGTAIFLSKKFQAEVVSFDKDQYGRWCWVTCIAGQKSITFASIYAPVEDNPKIYEEFFQSLIQIPGELILGGDFNVLMNPRIDSSVLAKKQLKPKTLRTIQHYGVTLDLLDPWRKAFPTKIVYTCLSGRFHTSSRIDFFLVSRSLSFCQQRVLQNGFSDHAMLALDLQIGECAKTPKRWMLNRQYLLEEDWVGLIEIEIRQFFVRNHDSAPLNTIWDTLKAFIRGLIIGKDAAITKKVKVEKRDLEQKVQSSYSAFLNNPTVFNQRQFDQAKCDLSARYYTLSESFFQHYRQKIYEESNFTGKFLAWQAREQVASNQINALKCPLTASCTDDPAKISEIMLQHYRSIYGQQQTVDITSLRDFLQQNCSPTLSENEKSIMARPFTKDELHGVIKNLPSGKACGPDGFPAEFFKVFYNSVADFFLQLVNSMLEGGAIPESFRQGNIVSFLKKGKVSEDPNSYRPITLLNSDYKIVTKLLANRFNQYASHLIHPDQNGFIAGRQLGTNTHYLTEALDYFETQKIPALVLLLDAEKAFDLVVWETLFIILQNFGISSKITGLVQNLYLNAEANVIINTSMAGQIKVKRGTRQGCPLSPVLFAFFIEPLAIAIRNSLDIRPPIPTMAKLKLYADDIMLFIKPDLEVQAKTFKIFEEFEALGGYRINKKKTEIIQCGGAGLDLHPDILSCLNTKPKRYLGVYFSERITDLFHLNFVPLLQKIQDLFARWNSLPLSILGRVALIKMSVLPLFNFLFSAIPCILFGSFFSRIESMFTTFLWAKKTPRIALSTLYEGLEQGGLALPNLRDYYFAYFAQYLSRFKPQQQSNLFINSFMNLMCKESQVHSPLSIFKSPKLVRYKCLQWFFLKRQALYKRYSIPLINSSTLLSGPMSLSGIRESTDLILKWANVGFRKISDFLRNGRWLSMAEMSQLIINDFLLLQSYSIFSKFLNELDLTQICNQHHIVHELLEDTVVKKPGEWKKRLALVKGVDLGSKAIAKWMKHEEVEISVSMWLAINNLNFSTLRGANWRRMLFFSKWQLYRTPLFLSKIYVNQSPQCFRCISHSTANWSHIILQCPMIQRFWKDIFSYLECECSIVLGLNNRLIILGFDPDLLLPDRLVKFLYIAMAVARSLLLQKWRTDLIPSVYEWARKMKSVKKSERTYALRVEGLKKFEKIWASYFD